MSMPAESRIAAHRCPAVELRQYTLHPGRRDELIALFEREFIAPQQAAGIVVLGLFRALDDPDRFVWLRGFSDMPTRARALAAFYDGPVWRAHRDAANATMLDSDDVLLLRPASAGIALPIEAWQRGGAAAPQGGLLAVVCPLASAPGARFGDAFRHAMAPAFARRGATLAGCYVSESSPNNFPRLPVREGAPVFVWLARFERLDACRRHAAELVRSFGGLDGIAGDLATRLVAPPQVLRLAPTAGSPF